MDRAHAEEELMIVKSHAAIVTGGGSGLGAATARALARDGAKVAVLDVNEDGARKVAAEIGGTAIRCDVSDGPSAEAAVAKAREAHGPARILLNCAGIRIRGRLRGRQRPRPAAPGQARGIRAAGAGDHRQPHDQRRDHPPRRRAADAAEIAEAQGVLSRSRGGAISSMAWARRRSKSDRPATSCVVRTISTRLPTLNHSG